MKTLCGSYRDVVSYGTGVELVTDGPGCETRARLAWYCVAPPGEAAWVVDRYMRIEGVEAGPSGTRTNNLTRYLDGENGEMEVISETESSKKLKSDMSGGELPGSVPGGPHQPSMNLPLPFPHGKASIVRLHDVKDGDIKLNN